MRNQSVPFPFAELHAKVVLEDSQSADCILYCPVLADPIK